MTVHYIPKGHHTIAPFFLVKNAHSLIDFVTSSFGAEVLSKIETPDGRVANIQFKIGDSILMVGERPNTFKNSTHIYVKDVDDSYKRCLKAGAKSISEPKTFPYGDRSAGVEDPEGNVWWIGTHVADVPR